MYLANLEKYKDPITTSENINELHHILVQTCLDYMRKNNLTDIDEINFTADGLSYSYEYGKWTPATDSSLCVVGLQIEDDSKIKYPVRRVIGESY
jgi:hypothetical protein